MVLERQLTSQIGFSVLVICDLIVDMITTASRAEREESENFRQLRFIVPKLVQFLVGF